MGLYVAETLSRSMNVKKTFRNRYNSLECDLTTDVNASLLWRIKMSPGYSMR